MDETSDPEPCARRRPVEGEGVEGEVGEVTAIAMANVGSATPAPSSEPTEVVTTVESWKGGGKVRQVWAKSAWRGAYETTRKPGMEEGREVWRVRSAPEGRG